MSLPNPWADPDALGAAAATGLARFIDGRGQQPDQARLQQALVELLGPQPGERVLDLGCGSGVIARRVAPLVGAAGTVHGVDRSAAMVQVAQELADHPALTFAQGDTGALTLPDASYDAALAARLLMHLTDPHQTLVEARRVVRPDGRLALLEFDWGTAAVDHSDRALTRRILAWRTDALDGDNWMGRQLAWRCGAAGWQVRQVSALVTLDTDGSTTLAGGLRRAAELAAQHGAISAAEQAAWTAELDARLAAGRFFASINDYLVLADR